VNAGAAIMVEEEDLHVEPLSQIVNEFFAQPKRALEMSQKALACGVPDAAERLADLVQSLDKGGET